MENLRYSVHLYNLKNFNYESSYHVTREGYERALEAAFNSPYVAQVRVEIRQVATILPPNSKLT